MSDKPTYLCPKCKLAWRRSVMEETRGSWTLQRVLICQYCDLWDYPDEEGPRRYGRPIIEKKRTS